MRIGINLQRLYLSKLTAVSTGHRYLGTHTQRLRFPYKRREKEDTHTQIKKIWSVMDITWTRIGINHRLLQVVGIWVLMVSD